MLKERVTDLLDEYEFGADIMTPHDVMEELQDIIDDEPCNQLTDDLRNAINEYIIDRHDYIRYHGHCSEGGEEFIAEVKRLVGYEE